MRRARFLALGVLVAAFAAIVLSACGSDGDSSSATTGGSETESTEVEEQTTTESADLPTTEPTTIPAKEALKSKPPTGKSVVVLACAQPTCQRYNAGFEGAAEALGWSVETATFDLADPNAAVQQAVAKSPDFIAIGGPPLAFIKSGVSAANAKGIPVFDHSQPEPTDESAGFYAGTNGPPSSELSATNMAEFMIDESGEDAHAVYYGLFDYPQQAAAAEAVKKAFAKCDGCSVDALPMTEEELGKGAVPANAVAYVQSHPDTNYVWVSFGDAMAGMSGALESSGLADKVKLISGESTSPATTKEVIEGKIAAMAPQSVNYIGWMTINQMARYDQGLKQPSAAELLMPAYVIDGPEGAEELPSSGIWPGPPNLEEEFEKLWKVG